MVSNRKLVKKMRKKKERKEAGFGESTYGGQTESLLEKRRGLETALRDVRWKACEKRGEAWRQCVTWCQIESL